MPLQYITPLEPNLDSIVQNPNDNPVLLVSSSGIPILHTLAKSDAEVTAVDFDKDQFLLLHILATAICNLDYELFFDFIKGENITSDLIIREVSRKLIISG